MVADGRGKDTMKDPPDMTPAMVGTVVAFLRGPWPLDRELDTSRACWIHDFSTTYQIACMALVALGEAEATEWGSLARAAI